ncbi:lanthionine synthetase C family protein [Frankia sp. AgB32]|uniref:lanthionine synthetase C family protein n=1 Tax=Frankia sp. AgB32 TaxID=631119 RepID=UPI00200DC62B|nr:lanthionine synthetase C family protein [Frankia sp. AgB32]MCK9895025.1 lanthionine synthetase C family protein [Frankia sp. AgB32]
MTLPTTAHSGPCLGVGDVDRARALAASIAVDLADPPPSATDEDCAPASARWHHQSLSKGAPGIALLHALRPSTARREESVHRWLRHATAGGLSIGHGAGLWFGAPAIAFAVTIASPQRYPDARATLDRTVAALTRARLDAAWARMLAAARPPLSEFDVVRGLTGLGAYLLRAAPDRPLLRDVLRYLVALTRPLPAHDAASPDAPGWWAADPPPGNPADLGGHANLGMAHGIAGPLALLALALRAGIDVPGQVDAIDRISDWLDTWRQPAPAGPWWPERITVADLRSGQPTQPGPARPSWCYGTPGLARAQQLAAIVRGDRNWQAAAEHALTACLTDPHQLTRLTDLSVCHGWAGVALTAWFVAADATTSGPAATLPGLTRAFLDHAVNPDPPSGRPARGLINGLAGAALVAELLAAPTTTGPPPWPSCLLLN